MSKITRSRKEKPTTKPSQPKPQIRRRLSGSDLDDDDGIFMLKPLKPHPLKHASSASSLEQGIQAYNTNTSVMAS